MPSDNNDEQFDCWNITIDIELMLKPADVKLNFNIDCLSTSYGGTSITLTTTQTRHRSSLRNNLFLLPMACVNWAREEELWNDNERAADQANEKQIDYENPLDATLGRIDWLAYLQRLNQYRNPLFVGARITPQTTTRRLNCYPHEFVSEKSEQRVPNKENYRAILKLEIN